MKNGDGPEIQPSRIYWKWDDNNLNRLIDRIAVIELDLCVVDRYSEV